MPIPSSNLGSCFECWAAPDGTAIIDIRDWDNPVELSYRAFDAECTAVARGLVKKGLKRGDRVGILSLNRFEALAAFFGAMRAGLVTVPISFKLSGDTVEYIVRDAGLKAVFHDDARSGLGPRGLLRIGFDERGGYEALKDPGCFEAIEPTGREVGMMLYTSGSTGKPKGVLLSHDSQLWGVRRSLTLIDNPSRHRYVVAAPMFHMNATFSVMLALASGASMILMPSFDAEIYTRAIERFRVTWLTSVPTMLALIAREIDLLDELDLSSVERVTMGSAPLTQTLVDKVQAIFPNAVITNNYGSTEAGPCPFGPHPRGIPRPSISLGYPLSGLQAELREGSSSDEGVLYTRSPMLMEGYNNLPQKTADVVQDGWYRSGDVMRRDEDGFFYFVGRSDDMFVVGGENVWPGEVERLVDRMPGVHQTIVVAVPDEIKGALPFAFIVRQPNAQIDEAAVKAFAIANGPAYAHPRFVAFIDAIPLAPTNKPDRRRLTEEAERLVLQFRSTAEAARVSIQ